MKRLEREPWRALAAVETVKYHWSFDSPSGVVTDHEPNGLCRFCRYFDAPYSYSCCSDDDNGEGCLHPFEQRYEDIADDMFCGKRDDCWRFAPRWPMSLCAEIVGCWLQGKSASVPIYRKQEAVVMLP